jgi:hypothetical protein
VSTGKRMCRQCSGKGKRIGYAGSVIDCYVCDETGAHREWSADFTDARYLANSDSDSDPVCVSNVRVFRENHADSEGALWRVRRGHGVWIEFRADLAELVRSERRDAVYERAARLGLTGLTGILDDMERLAQYPILDEDDMGECEQDEQTEHWNNYGRDDVRLDVCNWLEADGLHTTADEIRDMPTEDFDKAYWNACHDCQEYPERIDSSAWDFGTEARYGRKPRILEALVNRLMPVEGPALPTGDTLAVWQDATAEKGL